MYTEEEVRQLLIRFKAFLWEREDFSTAAATKWLSENKKKSDECKHQWVMTADPFDQSYFCKLCGKQH